MSRPASQEENQRHLQGLIQQYEVGDHEGLAPIALAMLGKFTESRKAAEKASQQLEQGRKQLEQLSQQLQQEIGKSAGYLEAILAACPCQVKEEAPANVEPIRNRRERRAEAAQARKE